MMTRYYFHVEDGLVYPDLQGTVFDNLAQAKTEALRFTGDLLSHEAGQFWGGSGWSMRVADAANKTIFTLKFQAFEEATDL